MSYLLHAYLAASEISVYNRLSEDVLLFAVIHSIVICFSELTHKHCSYHANKICKTSSQEKTEETNSPVIKSGS